MQSPQSAEELQPYSEIVALPTLKLHKRGGRMCVCVCVCEVPSLLIKDYSNIQKLWLFLH